MRISDYGLWIKGLLSLDQKLFAKSPIVQPEMKVYPSSAEEKLGFDVLRVRLEIYLLSTLGEDRLARMQPARHLDWLRAELERVTSRFQSAVSVNEAALRAARETTQRVLQAIADELDKNRRDQAGYSATGYGSTASYGGGVKPISIALDERL